MKFGVTLPPFGDFADPAYLAEMAQVAEDTGWDGFFIWDHVMFDPTFHPNTDPWVALAAVACHTQRLRIGTMVTPVARRRPWTLARQTAALDRLSGGRLTLGVGLGEPAQWDFGFFGEDIDARLRAQKLDEGLEILKGLWSGQPFQFDGQHYHLKPVTFLPAPQQTPRIPIWVGGHLRNKPPMRRAARWDGYFPIKMDGPILPGDWREALSYISQYRTETSSFDLVQGSWLPLEDWHNAAHVIEPYIEVGVTWWIEDVSPWRFGHSWESQWQPEFTRVMAEVIRRGPPKL